MRVSDRLFRGTKPAQKAAQPGRPGRRRRSPAGPPARGSSTAIALSPAVAARVKERVGGLGGRWNVPGVFRGRRSRRRPPLGMEILLVAPPAAQRRRGSLPARHGVHLIQQCETEPSKVGEPKSTRKTKLIALNEGIRQAIPRHQTRTEGGATWPSRPPTAQPPLALLPGVQHGNRSFSGGCRPREGTCGGAGGQVGRTWGISGSAEPAAPSAWPGNYSLWPRRPRKDAVGTCQPAVGST